MSVARNRDGERRGTDVLLRRTSAAHRCIPRLDFFVLQSRRPWTVDLLSQPSLSIERRSRCSHSMCHPSG
jgi:hypothetical protein